ncbi:MAG: hypothetical protein HOC23_15015 [Halieaceae bacterium]|jgi:hypothetical protein|nr:hypothetical protein [Halieaceae bacterium]
MKKFLVEDNNVLPYIKVTMPEVVDSSALDKLKDKLLACPGFQTKDQLIDYSGVTHYTISSADLRRYVNGYGIRKVLDEARAGRRIALVAPTDMEFGMARVFLSNTEDLPASYQVFRALEDALQWLDQPPVD